MSGTRLRRLLALITVFTFLAGCISYYYYDFITPLSVQFTPSTISIPWLSHSNTTSSTPSQTLKESPPATNLSTYDFHDLLKVATKGADGNLYPPQYVNQETYRVPKAKAGFIVLVRNSELDAMKKSMMDVENRFNKKFRYPWIFLNNDAFTDEFKEGVKQMTSSETRFGLVPKEHWSYPDWISEEKAAETRKKMKDKVPYGDSESYRHMCRYQSGFFFRHPLTLDLDFYWRVEPGIKLFCDIDYDPFVFMAMNNKTYGFTIALHEFVETVATLYQKTRDFIKLQPGYLNNRASYHFLADKPDQMLDSNWNLCHFWSNFEIADLRFWRSKEYLEYFDYLDKSGGFFYERWGDAPVHSLAVALFQDKSRLHQFDDIGYFHAPWTHCPTHPNFHKNGRCQCDPATNFDKDNYSCLKEWWADSDEKEPHNPVPRSLRL